ncbi:hypothetical protein H206_06109 [Candidatus Electrothrix aarhusensis]|uniref:Uncharacterized protein n=1 Tax=Candidatus Electrothrix aarhusensis TaxID=1859131 RepID=A0A444J3W3_9BACT|nr:hypothetical protein H206_06109 [Candidatus Electrothrix aarhusensis]
MSFRRESQGQKKGKADTFLSGYPFEPQTYFLYEKVSDDSFILPIFILCYPGPLGRDRSYIIRCDS